MIVLPIIGFVIIAALNCVTSKVGYINLSTGDKDILFPFSSTIFLFFSLLIYLPQINAKINILQQQSPNLSKQIEAQQQQENFPTAFLFILLSIAAAVFIDKFFLNKSQSVKDPDQKSLKHNNHHGSSHDSTEQNQKNKYEASTLKYYLTVSILLNNLFSSYFITVQHKQQSIWAELLIFMIFSLIINFCYGFLLAWIDVEQQLFEKFTIFMNAGLIAGLILGIFLKVPYFLVILPCISIGLSIYASSFICFPKIFSGGQNANQDKFRYLAIIIALLLTLVYYPILYLLKI